MSNTLQEREDQIELCDGDHVFRQVEGQSVSECVCGAIRDYDDAQSTTTAGYCEECKGQPHAPWCSEYKEADEHCPFTRTWVPDPCVLPKGHTGRHMNAIEQEIATSEHQPAARGGGERIKVELINGVEGQCVAVNDYRICGPKPWGGGSIAQSWTTDKNDILRAFLTPDQKHAWLADDLQVVSVKQHQSLVAERERLRHVLRLALKIVADRAAGGRMLTTHKEAKEVWDLGAAALDGELSILDVSLNGESEG